MTTPTKPTYVLELVMNGETFKKRTTNLNEAFLKMAPEFLHTEMYVTLKKGKLKTERKLTLIDGRKLFANEDFREVFINNLILE